MTTTNRPARRVGRHRYAVPAAGMMLAAAGTLVVVGLADSATESDGLAGFDPALTADVVAARSAPLTGLAHALTFLGSTPVLVLLTVVAAAVLRVVTRSWRAPGLLLVAMAGSAMLTYGLKVTVGRARPGADLVLGPLNTGFAFPSGHSLNSAVFFAVMAGLAWVRFHAPVARAAAAAAAVVLSVGVGVSRVYLGYHWATDVLAGWLVAATWLTVLGTLTYLIRRRPGPVAPTSGA